MPTHRPPQTRKLSADQWLCMIEWISHGFTNDGSAAHIDHWNRSHDPVQHFPTITASALSYWCAKFKRQVAAEQRRTMERYQEVVQHGLRHREKRIDWLIVAAEPLVPYLGEASPKGDFTASQQFSKLIAQNTLMVDGDPKTASKEPIDLDLSALSTAQLRALAASL